MKTSALILAITMNLIVGRIGCGQITDWRALVRDAASADPAVVDATRERLFKVLTPQLDAAEAKSLDKDIAAILEAFNDEEPIRLQASGLIAGLAMSRRDGSEALKRAVPVLLSQFSDHNERVRENAIWAIVSLRPQVPSEALTSLLTVARGEDSAAARPAIYGVARLASTSPVAMSELGRLLSADQAVQIRRATVLAIGQVGVANSPLISKLGEILGEKDRDLVKETISAVSMIGPPAAGLIPILQRVADTAADKELSKAATDAISRLKR